MIVRAWVTLAVTLIPVAASASGLSAASMVEKCESIEIAKKGPAPIAEKGVVSFLQHTQNSIYCREYFDGFLDGWHGRFEISLMRAAEITDDVELEKMTEALELVSPSLCNTAEGVTTGQAIGIFMDFVQRHPDLERDAARSVIPRSLSDAYPCPPASAD